MFYLTHKLTFGHPGKFRHLVIWRASFHKEDWKILYFGTDKFAVKPLKHLNNCKLSGSLISDLEVICPPEKRRPKDIKRCDDILTVRQFAETHGLNIHNWPLDRKNFSFLSRFHLGIVISFGHFIPSWIVNSLPWGAINFHPSLLPKWRGASPMVHALLNGEKETGVSIIEVSSRKFDSGSVLLQRKVQIPVNTTYNDLSEQLSQLSCDMLGEVLSNFNEYKSSATPQDEKSVTSAPKVTKELEYIQWNRFSCQDIQRLWCAIGQRFGLKCMWNNTVVKLGILVETQGSLEGVSDTAVAGQPFFDSSRNVLFIKCMDGWVGWKTLQMEYRQAITAQEFYNGYLIDKTTGRPSKNIFYDMRKCH